MLLIWLCLPSSALLLWLGLLLVDSFGFWVCGLTLCCFRFVAYLAIDMCVLIVVFIDFVFNYYFAMYEVWCGFGCFGFVGWEILVIFQFCGNFVADRG